METIPDPAILTVLGYASLAAIIAAFGTLPFIVRDHVPVRWVGWAYALASGLMIGAGYVLMTEGLHRAVWPVALGALAGVGFTFAMQSYTGTRELETSPDAALDSGYIVKFVLLNALHSASEGVAIGVAMAVNLTLGAFVALSLAVHNVAEALVLTDVLRRHDMRVRQAAPLSIITNIPMVLMAIVTFALVPAVPGVLPWLLGVNAGALLYLVMTELLPSAYERSGRTAIAVMVSVTAGGVVFLRDFFVR